MRKFIFLLVFVSVYVNSSAQFGNWQVCSPVDFETTLSGSFAEMRRNHFHGGLDFRTNGEENKPIYAVADGYVSRISISRTGYGKCVHIAHPNGFTTVYGHLNGFIPRIDSIVKAKQYGEKKFEVDMDFGPGVIPVKKGEQFAISGNTGASGGPHLHFEVRRTSDQALQNPLLLNKYFGLKDTRAPRINAVKIYGLDDEGRVNDQKEQRYNVVVNKAKQRVLKNGQNITAWGKLGFAVKAVDFMSNTSFKYTPRNLKLYVDNTLISDVTITDIKFSDTRALNGFIDYAQQVSTGEFFMKSFKDKNLPLHLHDGLSGTIYVDKEKDYHVKYVVTDDFGNSDQFAFVIHGKKTSWERNTIPADSLIRCGEAKFIVKEDFCLQLPDNAIYTDVPENYSRTAPTRPGFFSDIHQIGSWFTPVHCFCDISLRVTNDSLEDKSKYYISKVTEKGLPAGAICANYNNGYVVGRTNSFGKFAVAADLVKPTILPMHTKNIPNQPFLRLKINDAQSGIASYDGYIDGKWVMFEFDYKTRLITFWMDSHLVEKNKNHTLKVVVKDNCGNEAEYDTQFYW